MFSLSPEEATTAGPYCLGLPRPLTGMEIAYTEWMVEEELMRALSSAGLSPASQPSSDQAGSAGHLAMGRQVSPVRLPTPIGSDDPAMGPIAAKLAP